MKINYLNVNMLLYGLPFALTQSFSCNILCVCVFSVFSFLCSISDAIHFFPFWCINLFLFCMSFCHTHLYTISIFKTNVANFDNSFFFCLDINRTHKTIEMTDTWSTYLTIASC